MPHTPKEEPAPPSAEAQAFLERTFPGKRLSRVLLVTPPDADAEIFRFETAKRGRYTNYPPYGLLVLASNLRQIGIDVRVLNLNDEILAGCHKVERSEEFDFDAIWTDALKRAIDEFCPDLAGVTCMFTMTHGSFKAVCQAIALNKVPLAIGGVHVTNNVDGVLDDVPEAHFAFSGEGDRSFKNFVEVARGTLPPAALGQVIFNDPANPDPALRRLRFDADLRPTESEINIVPAYDLIGIDRYSSRGTIGAFYCFKPKTSRFATVLSNRGCRARCTFCSVRNFNGPGVRQRSVESVVDEIELLRDEHGIDHIMWLDDDLFKDERRMVALCNEIVRRNLGITWDATNGLIASSCTDEVIAASAASGCIAVNIGMESGNREILKRVRKPGTIETFLRAAEVLKRYEQIHASVFLVIGFPGETLRMITDSIEVATQMDLDWYRISQLQPLPNTPLHEAMVEQGLIGRKAGDKELRFMGGAYGKQAEIEQGLRMTTSNFLDAFSSIPLDEVPTPEQITDIWFYMNYHLNFRRIFHETKPAKIRQLIDHLKVLSDVISPENGFSLYFLGVLQQRQTGTIDPELIDRLRRRLRTSAYWSDRLAAFGLAVEHLEQGVFPNETITPPRFAASGSP